MQINEHALEQLEADVGADMMPMILGEFVKELDERAARLAVALAERQIAEIAELAHSLKSTARTVGLDTLADCAGETERQGRAGMQQAAMQQGERLAGLCAEGRAVLVSYRGAGAR